MPQNKKINDNSVSPSSFLLLVCFNEAGIIYVRGRVKAGEYSVQIFQGYAIKEFEELWEYKIVLILFFVTYPVAIYFHNHCYVAVPKYLEF